MLSPEYIRSQSAQAAKVAAWRGQYPYEPFDAQETESWQSFPFPSLGDFIPEGYELIDSLFCDSSGLGQRGEAPLTAQQLREYCTEHLADNYSYALGDIGQFQVNVNVFKRIK